MNLEKHPSVMAYRKSRPQADHLRRSPLIAKDQIKALVREAGADDVGVVSIDHPDISDQKRLILEAFPKAKTLISMVGRMNIPQVRSADRALVDAEFIGIEKELLAISRRVVKGLRKEGIASVTTPEGFPQDMSKWPDRMFTVSHKPVAAAAGLGHIGHHRLLIHPEFGSHACLGTIIMDAALDEYDTPLVFNPCISCKLCTAVCPTGAISKDGAFEFFDCFLHAYRDRLGGFLNWTQALVESRSMDEYRIKRSDEETLAVWQSLTYGGGYRCGYCMSVCPAGTNQIGSYIDHQKGYFAEVVKPLIERQESVYVIPGAISETSLAKRFPNKTARPV